MLKNSEIVGYKVISKIITDDEKVVDTIRTFVSNTIKTTENDEYILQMENGIYPQPVSENFQLLQAQVFVFNVMSNRAENIELGFNFSPYLFKGLYFELCYTNGRYVDGYSSSLFKLLKVWEHPLCHRNYGLVCGDKRVIKN